jgi:hypothetical protein
LPILSLDFRMLYARFVPFKTESVKEISVMLLREGLMSIQLAPEVEAIVRAQAAARGVKPESLIAEAVEAFTHAPSMPRLRSSRTRSAEMAWAADPDPQYFGKWVVLEGSRVIGSDSDPKRLYEDVRSRGCGSPFLIFVSPRANEPFLGGWID